MAEIKMSYIFIEKQKHESKEMQEILLEVIDDAVRVLFIKLNESLFVTLF